MLGYHAVRCRGQKCHDDGDDVQRGLIGEEKFFSNQKPWSSVDKSLVGTKNLRSRLSGLLEYRIGESLPQVRKDIQTQLKEVSNNLEKIGPELDSTSMRREQFYRIIDKMKDILQCSLKGMYDEAFFDEENNRMCSELEGYSSDFDKNFAIKI